MNWFQQILCFHKYKADNRTKRHWICECKYLKTLIKDHTITHTDNNKEESRWFIEISLLIFKCQQSQEDANIYSALQFSPTIYPMLKLITSFSCIDIYCFDSYLTNFHATNILSLILKPISCTFKDWNIQLIANDSLTFSSTFNFPTHNHHKCPAWVQADDVKSWHDIEDYHHHTLIECLISLDSNSQAWCWSSVPYGLSSDRVSSFQGPGRF